jgi:hypothetical protein
MITRNEKKQIRKKNGWMGELSGNKVKEKGNIVRKSWGLMPGTFV